MPTFLWMAGRVSAVVFAHFSPDDGGRTVLVVHGRPLTVTDDTVFAVYMDGERSEPTYVLQGRESLTPVFADLNRYEATTHFNGQSTVTLDGDHATGESYTIAHHVYTEAGDRKIMVALLRYSTPLPRSKAAGTSRSASSSSTGARRDRWAHAPASERHVATVAA